MFGLLWLILYCLIAAVVYFVGLVICLSCVGFGVLIWVIVNSAWLGLFCCLN